MAADRIHRPVLPHRHRRMIGVLTGTALLAALALALGAAYVFTLVPDLPQLRQGTAPKIALASVAYTADGQELARFYRKNRTWMAYEQIAPAVIDALVATEDHRFYDHRGVDFTRLVGAMLKTLRGTRQGASTLTMQLARNRYPEVGRAPTLRRKLREMLTAFKIERRYTKREILEMYLNTVPFGFNAYGIEAAARTYFNKPAAQLDVPEAAMLVGMLKATTAYNPVRHPERAHQRRNVVLQQMMRHGYLETGRLLNLWQEPLGLDFQPPARLSPLAPHFTEHLRGWLEDWAAQHGYDLYAAGLRIYTTLDARLQQQAQQAVEAQLSGLQAVVDYEWSQARPALLARDPVLYQRLGKEASFTPFAHLWNAQPALETQYMRQTPRFRRALRRGQAASAALAALRADTAFVDSLRTARTRLEAGLLALDPTTGYVKAWVGGRDFAQDQYDKVALARRQPGSTFKPFVYAAAVERGFAPGDQVVDAVRTYALSGRRSWTPRNAGHASGDKVTLRKGLAYSKNTVTAFLMHEIGPYEVARTAERMGIRSALTEVPSLALGTSEVTLHELTSAYATLAANGRHHPPRFVTRIEDAQGHVLARFRPTAHKALSMYTAYTVLDMLRSVVNEGTGIDIRRRFGLTGDLAGKTGTTQHNADGWFLLMHPRLVAGAWVGFSDRRLHFRTGYWGQGAHNALRMVGDFFQRLEADTPTPLPDVPFQPPPGYREPVPYRTVEGGAFYAYYDSLGASPNARRAVSPRQRLTRDSLRQPDTAHPDADAERALRRATAPSSRPVAPALPMPQNQEADVELLLRRRSKQ